jgi:phosphoribosylformylglycinamidine synthase subunit PurQ / glutaminase
MNSSACVFMGHGINCENETGHALRLAGFDKIDLVHLNYLTGGEIDLFGYNLLVFPGGFLDGDDLGAAQACANRLKFSEVRGTRIIDQVIEFINRGGLILGICNGFQLLVKLGLLPAVNRDYGARDLTLTANAGGRFEDRWVTLVADDKSPCVFTSGLRSLYLPVRHGEGKLIAKTESLLDRLEANGQAVLKYADPSDFQPTMTYPLNPNGATRAIAGICDETGRVFGLMPHPECYVHRTQHPRWTREDLPEEGVGLMIFKNARNYVQNL